MHSADRNPIRVSVVIRSKDEADRLRLALASLAMQTMPSEVIVIDDGSSDHTQTVVAEAAQQFPVRSIRHAAARGRSAAANAGAQLASGEILLFMDGDVIAHRDLVARHAALHEWQPNRVGRGETWHLRGPRFLQDPERGTPRPGEEARIGRLAAVDLARMKVTRAQVIDDFAAIERRAEPAIYPGAGPRRLYELEMEALRDHAGCSVLWAAASGHNLSIRREAFLASGGFDEELDINEHRELCLRLCAAGARMEPVLGARSYHLTHRSGWRDPLHDTRWEHHFYRKHPLPEVELLAIFWASISDGSKIPPAARIASLPELEAAARGERAIDVEAIRRLFPGLPDLRLQALTAPTVSLQARGRV